MNNCVNLTKRISRWALFVCLFSFIFLLTGKAFAAYPQTKLNSDTSMRYLDEQCPEVNEDGSMTTWLAYEGPDEESADIWMKDMSSGEEKKVAEGVVRVSGFARPAISARRIVWEQVQFNPEEESESFVVRSFDFDKDTDPQTVHESANSLYSSVICGDLVFWVEVEETEQNVNHHLRYRNLSAGAEIKTLTSIAGEGSYIGYLAVSSNYLVWPECHWDEAKEEEQVELKAINLNSLGDPSKIFTAVETKNFEAGYEYYGCSVSASNLIWAEAFYDEEQWTCKYRIRTVNLDDGANPQIKQVASGEDFLNGIDISGNTVVWEATINISPVRFEIRSKSLSDLSAPAQTVASSNRDSCDPKIGGSLVVWWQWNGADGTFLDIMGKQLPAGQVTQVNGNHTAPAYQILPQISGDKVVWLDDRDRNSMGVGTDIYLKDLSSEDERSILHDFPEKATGYSEPAISGNLVIWPSRDSNGHGTVKSKNLKTNAVNTLVAVQDNQAITGSALSQNILVWAQSDWKNLTSEMKAKDLNSGGVVTLDGGGLYEVREPDVDGFSVVWVKGNTIQFQIFGAAKSVQVAQCAGWIQDLAVSGMQVVWVEDDLVKVSSLNEDSGAFGAPKLLNNGAWLVQGCDIWENMVVWSEGDNIYVYDLQTDKKEQITSDNAAQVFPKIDGNTVVWEDWRNGNADVYMTKLNIQSGASHFMGDGNSFMVDKGFVAPGGILNFRAEYRNNSDENISGPDAKVLVVSAIPANTELVSGSITRNGVSVSDEEGTSAAGEVEVEIGNLPAHAGGVVTYQVRVKPDTPVGTAISASGAVEYFTPERHGAHLGTTLTEVGGITLSGPTTAHPGDTATVYGETIPDATVKIYDGDTLIGEATASGRWWSKKILLSTQGTHTITATVGIGERTIISAPLKIEVDPNVPVLGNVGIEAGWNGRIGVPNPYTNIPSFSIFQGEKMGIEANISNNPASVWVEFLGARYPLSDPDHNGVYTGAISPGWNGFGKHQGVVYFTDSAGKKTYSAAIFEATILIDPSGYIFNAAIGEGSRIQGATITLQHEDGGVWKDWDAASYGQVNPQVTDSQGRYGWDVPAGNYRIRVTKNGYEEKVSSVVTVPPPVLDLNVGLKDIEAPTVSIDNPADGANVKKTVNILATVADNSGTNGIAKVEFYIDDVLKATDTAYPYSYPWDTTLTPGVSHTVKVVAYDKAGNTAYDTHNCRTPTTYYFTWYDQASSAGMFNWILVSNPDFNTANADVEIYVAGTKRWSGNIVPGKQETPWFPGVMGGPVEVVCNNGLDLVVSSRVICNGSFNEIFATTKEQVTTNTNAQGQKNYYFTWYDQASSAGMFNWILVSNPDFNTDPANIEIWIAGEKRWSGSIAPGKQETPWFPGVMGGPVKVICTNNLDLIVSSRVICNGSFNEIFAMTREGM